MAFAGSHKRTHLVLHQGRGKHGLAAGCCAGIQDPLPRLRVQHQHNKPRSFVLHLQASALQVRGGPARVQPEAEEPA